MNDKIICQRKTSANPNNPFDLMWHFGENIKPGFLIKYKNLCQIMQNFQKYIIIKILLKMLQLTMEELDVFTK